MAFEHLVFSDGEMTYQTPEWRKNLEAIDHLAGVMDYDTLNTKKKEYQADDIGFRHPKNGSFFRIKEDGTIEMFTAYGTGVRIKPDNTIQLFGDKIQHIGREVGFTTSPNYGIDNSAYNTYPKERGLSQEFIQYAKDTGIETYDIEEWK